LVELQDISEKDPLHWVHIIVFGLAVMVFLFMTNMMRPALVSTEDPNSVKLQVVERKK
jgi:hypothetical protein